MVVGLLFFSCAVQKSSFEKYNWTIYSDNYTIKMRLIGEAHNIQYSRKVDSLSFNMTITPSLRKIFDSVTNIEDCRLIIMSISKNAKDIYKLKQMNFIHFDGRNISLHNYSDHIFNVDLSAYKIEMNSCNNCSNQLSFVIYKHDKN